MDSPSSSSSDSDSLMDEDSFNDINLEPIDDEEYRQCRSFVDLNKFSYQAHMKWILAQERKYGIGSKESNKSREETLNIFPQPEEFWIKWIESEKYLYKKTIKYNKDNINIIEYSRNYLDIIHNLVLKSQNDYQSINIWIEYINQVKYIYKKGYITLNDVRNSYEEAIEYCSHHFTQSILIWDSYHDFEQSVLGSIEALSDQIPKETIEEQEKKTRKVFFRAISIPSKDYQSIYDDYKSFESCRGNKIPAHIKKTFDKTKKLSLERIPYENKIILNDSHTFDNPDYSKYNEWIEYIDWEIKKKSVPRTLSLFERAVSNYSLSIDIWTRFCDFTINNLMKRDLYKVNTICKRAIRNCSWSGKLWECYLFSLELLDSNDYEKEFEKAIQSNIQSPQDMSLIYRAYIDYHWRKLEYSTNDINSLSKQYINNFRIALGKAKKYFGDNKFIDIHCNFILESFKYNNLLSNNIEKSQWDKILLKYPKEETFQNALQSLLYQPKKIPNENIKDIRNIYKTSLKVIEQWSQNLCDNWLWFERIYGDLESYIITTNIIAKKQNFIYKQYQQNQKQQKQSSLIGKRKKNLKQQKTKEPPLKKQKIESLTLYISNLPWKKEDGSPISVEYLENELKKHFSDCGEIKNIRIVKNNENKLTGFSFIDFISSDSVTKAINKQTIYIEKRPIKVQISDNIEKIKVTKEKTSSQTFSDENTIFISNFPFKATDAEIRELFKDCDIKDIRLNRNSKNGLLLGYGYIEMNDKQSVENACKLHLSKFKERKINVVISKPKHKRERKPKDRPITKKTKDIQHTNPKLLKIKRGNLFAPRSLLTKVISNNNSKKEEKKEEKPKIQVKTNDDFKKLLSQ